MYEEVNPQNNRHLLKFKYRESVMTIIKLFLILSIFTNLSLAQIFWQQTNGPYGGIIWDISSAPGGNLFTSAGSGLYKSTDLGQSWHRSDIGISVFGDGVLRATSDGILIYGLYSSIFRSFDMGNSWVDQGTLGNSGRITCMAIDAQDFLFAGTYFGIYRSTDKGISWSKVFSVSTSSETIYSIAIDSNRVVYAGTEGSGILKSTDNGLTWIQTNLQSYYINDLVVGSENRIFAATWADNVWYSTDGGLNWIQSYTVQAYLKSLVRNTLDHIYVGMEPFGINGGVYKSTNNGLTWNSLNSGLFYLNNSMNCFGSINDLTFVGTSRDGIYKSQNNKNTWSRSTNGIFDTQNGSVTINVNGSIFVSTNSRIYKSTDRGENWKPLITESGEDFSGVKICINNENILFAAGFYSYLKSTDDGETWDPLPGWEQTNVTMHYVNSGGILFVQTQEKLIRSTDEGLNWQQITLGLPADVIFREMLENGSDRLYGCTVFKGIYYSTDDGVSWSGPIGGGTSGSNISSITFDSNGFLLGSAWNYIYKYDEPNQVWNVISTQPFNIERMITLNTGDIYGYSQDSVYHSSDDGYTWHNFSDGFAPQPYYLFNSLDADSNGYLYVGTATRGIFRTSSSVTSIINNHNSENISVYNLMQNYPNPFNPVTKISYALPNAATVELKVYNVLGQLITTLVNEEKPAGFYEVDFNAANLPSGVYMYRIQAGDYVETKKMLLLK